MGRVWMDGHVELDSAVFADMAHASRIEYVVLRDPVAGSNEDPLDSIAFVSHDRETAKQYMQEVLYRPEDLHLYRLVPVEVES